MGMFAFLWTDTLEATRGASLMGGFISGAWREPARMCVLIHTSVGPLASSRSPGTI